MSLLLKAERVARVPDVLGEIVPGVGPKCEKVQKPWVLRLKRWSLSMRVSDEESGKDCKGVIAQKDKRERNL